jgi:hypothetical protein
MIVCLCGSFKFIEDIRGIETELCSLGITCLSPSPFEFRDKERPSEFVKEWFALTKEEQLKASRDAESRFLGKIDKSDFVYIVNPDGYIGASVTLEIGYAFAKSKPIFALETIGDITVMSLVDSVLNPKELSNRLEESY